MYFSGIPTSFIASRKSGFKATTSGDRPEAETLKRSSGSIVVVTVIDDTIPEIMTKQRKQAAPIRISFIFRFLM
ncbi:hypothetical protein GCM10011573_34210 [Enterococcus wangshanyuanii]|uniref:Uncharacterized protein n=1 Tax=Enterococcus wangshanyuanii TaxID=2005703 RepID=A0ABQ1PRS6_9ENTE|nr:hypothetical protein GCM10011573_34210 [Enterococcus wangshanyuanii]